MADVAFGLAGAYVGSFFGMPGLGYSIGSAVGGSLFSDPIKTKGPRLKDLRVQTASDGTPIPIVYGTSRVAGYVKWSTGLIEKKHTDSSGGKGGPSQEHTSYTYKASFAVGLCEGEIKGIRKIWADGRLIYDISEDAALDIETEAVSGAIEDLITVYTGSDSQGPDAVIEAWAGTGNAPAWRGEGYVVFENLQLGKYGNRIPNMEFEVVGVGDEFDGNESQYAIKTYYDWAERSASAIDPRNLNAPSGAYSYTYPADGGTVYDSLNEAIEAMAAAQGYSPRLLGWSFNREDINWSYPVNATSENEAYLHYNEYTPGDYFTDSVDLDYFVDGIGLTHCQFVSNDTDKVYWATGSASSPGQVAGLISTACTTGAGGGTPQFTNALGGVSCLSISCGGGNITTLFQPDVFIKVTRLPVCPSQDCDCSETDIELGVAEAGLCTEVPLPENPAYCVNLDTGDIRRRIIFSDQGTGQFHVLQAPIIDLNQYVHPDLPSGDNQIDILVQNSLGPVLEVGSENDTEQWWSERTNDALEGTFEWPSVATDAAGWRTVWPDSVDASAHDLICVATFNKHTLDPNPITLDVIVADLTERAGLTSDDYDVTELEETLVWGYQIDNPMSAREAMQPLIAAYHFYGVESDGVIKYKLKQQDAVATITENELDMRSYGTSSGAALQVTRTQELELPKRLRVQFQDFSNDHQVGQEYSLRQTVESESVTDVPLAITMYPSQAAIISDVLLREAWLGRTAYELSVPRDYVYIDPGDVISVTQGSASHLIRVLHTEFLGGKVKLKGVAYESTLFNSFATADDTEQGQVISGLLSGPTVAKFYDIPAIADTDDNAGYYFGLSGPLSGWQGGSLQRSDDGGANWDDLASSEVEHTYGTVETAISAAESGVFDRGTEITVSLTEGELSSTTEASLLSGTNLCAVGVDDRWELLQFRDATLNVDGTYTLSHLLRGRFGTEWAIGTHEDEEQFVLLDSKVVRYPSSISRINLQARYRAVSFGAPAQGAAQQLFTPGGVGLECYSPVHIKAVRDGSDVTVTWKRRTRLPNEWADFVDAPLNETTESYEIDVYESDGTTFIETLTTTEETVDYTTADTVKMTVYQMSANVGRGYPSETVTI